MKKTTIARIVGAVFLLTLLVLMKYLRVEGLPFILTLFGAAYAFEVFIVQNIQKILNTDITNNITLALPIKPKSIEELINELEKEKLKTRELKDKYLKFAGVVSLFFEGEITEEELHSNTETYMQYKKTLLLEDK